MRNGTSNSVVVVVRNSRSEQVSEFSSEFPFVSEICTQGSGFLLEFAARRENVFKNHEPEMPPGPLLARSRIAPGSILVEKPLVLLCFQPLPDRSRIHVA